MRAGRILILLTFISASLVAVTMNGSGYSAGAPENAAQGGCTCHGQESTAPRLILAGLVGGAKPVYMAGTTYNLTLTVKATEDLPPGVQNKGGLAVRVEPMGGLAPVDDKTQMTGQTLTHTAAGNDQRTWMFSWTPPANATGIATLYAAANAVNGNTVPDPGDLWAKATYTIEAMDMGPTKGSPSVAPSTSGSGTPGLSFVAALAVVGFLVVGSRR